MARKRRRRSKVRRAVRRVKRRVVNFKRRRRAQRRARVVTRTVRRTVIVKRRTSRRRRRGPVGGVRRGFAFIPPTDQIVTIGGGAVAGAIVAEWVSPKVFKDPKSFFNTSELGNLLGQGLIGIAGFIGLKKVAPKYALPFFVGTLVLPAASLFWGKIFPAGGTKGIFGLGNSGPMMIEGADQLQGGVYEAGHQYVNA